MHSGGGNDRKKIFEMKLKKILLLLGIVQEKTIDGRLHKRLNPYNPLTYVVVAIAFIVSVILFGVVGWKKEVNLFNEFKYKK